jgi:hypothetical protein
MVVERPFATLRAMLTAGFRPGNVRRTLLPMFMRRLALSPKELNVPAVSPPGPELPHSKPGRETLRTL